MMIGGEQMPTENVTTKFKVDISDLKKGLKESTDKIKLLNAELKNADAEMKNSGNSIDGLNKKIEKQSAIVAEETKKLDALKAELAKYNKVIADGDKTVADLTKKQEEAVKVYGEGSKEAKEYAKQLDAAKAAQERNIKAANDLKVKIVNQDTAVKNAGGKVKQFEKELDELQAEMSGDAKTADETNKAFDGVGKAAGDAADDAKKAGDGGFTVFKGVMANLTTQVINKATEALKGFVKQIGATITETAKAGDEIDKTSQKIGISAESYQEWAYVFERSGADVDKLEGGMKKLSKVITDAGNGSKSAAQKLAAVGLSVKDLNGLSQDEQLSLVISRLQEMESGAKRTAAANGLLGSSSTDMAAVLNMTAKETENLKKEAQDYGMIMSNEAVKSSATFEDSLTKLKGTATGVKTQLASQFLPEVTKVFEGLSDTLAGKADFSKVLDTIGGIVEKNLPKVVTILSKLGESIGKTIEKGLPKIIEIVSKSAPTLIETFTQIVVKLAAALVKSAPDLITAILSMATEILNTITAELPTIVNAIVEIIPQLVTALTDPAMIEQLMQAAVTLLMAIVQALPQILIALTNALPQIIDTINTVFLSNQDLMFNTFLQVMMSLVEAIPMMIAHLIPALGQILSSFVSHFITPVVEKFKSIYKTITGILSPIAKYIGDLFSQAWTNIKTAFSSVGEFFTGVWGKIKGAFSAVGTWFKSIFTTAWTNIKSVFSGVGSFFGGIWTTIKSKFTSVGTKVAEAIGGAFKSAINAVIGTVEGAINLVPKAINGALDLINKLPGVEIDPIGEIELPRLAKGGVVNRATLAQIGEAGAEAIIPLERNKAGLKLIADALANEMKNTALATGQTIGGNTYNFTQTNNSPKALSRWEIYRQTKNLISAAKGV